MATTITFDVSAYDDDGLEDQTNNTWDPGSTYEFPYDWIDARNDFALVSNPLIKFQNVTIPSGATITSATLTTNEAGGGSAITGGTVTCVGDEGSGRNDAFSASSRYETGWTATTETVVKADTDFGGPGTSEDWDVTAIVQEIVDDASGGWSSGDDLRFAFLRSYGSGEGVWNLSAYWLTATPDHAEAASISIVYTTGGGGSSVLRLVSGGLINGSLASAV